MVALPVDADVWLAGRVSALEPENVVPATVVELAVVKKAFLAAGLKPTVRR
jgi:hypothetical protein